MSAGISPENERFLNAAVLSGAFSSRDEALDQAVALLRERTEAMDRIRRHPVELPPLPPVLERRGDGMVYFVGHRISFGMFLRHLFAGSDQASLESQFESLAASAIAAAASYARQHPQAALAFFEQYEALEGLQRDDSRRGPGVNELRNRIARNAGS